MEPKSTRALPPHAGYPPCSEAGSESRSLTGRWTDPEAVPRKIWTTAELEERTPAEVDGLFGQLAPDGAVELIRRRLDLEAGRE
jgi:hypothetical protein